MSDNKIIFQDITRFIEFDNGILSSEGDYIEIYDYQELTAKQTRELYKTMKNYYENLKKNKE